MAPPVCQGLGHWSKDTQAVSTLLYTSLEDFMFRVSCFMFTGSLHIIHASSSNSFTGIEYMLSTMSKVMSTAELKSLLEKRRREKDDQDEREQLLKEIRELDAYASVSSSSVHLP